MKVIIAGSREFNDYILLKSYCDYVLQNQSNIEIISGTARGPDKLGEQYAKGRGYKLTKFPANWNEHGKKAGMIRNKEMADYAEALIAFWNGKSKGTKNMIETAKKNNLKTRVKRFEN